MSDEEVVLTSRRARWRTADGRWEAGRLHVSDRRVRVTAHGGASTEVLLVAVTAVRVVRWPRPTLVLECDGAPLRIRCFAVPAVAGLVLHGSG